MPIGGLNAYWWLNSQFAYWWLIGGLNRMTLAYWWLGQWFPPLINSWPIGGSINVCFQFHKWLRPFVQGSLPAPISGLGHKCKQTLPIGGLRVPPCPYKWPRPQVQANTIGGFQLFLLVA
jgi:hypothetical protein